MHVALRCMPPTEGQPPVVARFRKPLKTYILTAAGAVRENWHFPCKTEKRDDKSSWIPGPKKYFARGVISRAI
jgi:hypothetical protein